MVFHCPAPKRFANRTCTRSQSTQRVTRPRSPRDLQGGSQPDEGSLPPLCRSLPRSGREPPCWQSEREVPAGLLSTAPKIHSGGCRPALQSSWPRPRPWLTIARLANNPSLRSRGVSPSGELRATCANSTPIVDIPSSNLAIGSSPWVFSSEMNFLDSEPEPSSECYIRRV